MSYDHIKFQFSVYSCASCTLYFTLKNSPSTWTHDLCAQKRTHTLETNLNFELLVFRIVTTCIDMAGYWRFRGPCCIFTPEDGCSMVLPNVGILPHHYTIPQPRRPRLESS